MKRNLAGLVASALVAGCAVPPIPPPPPVPVSVPRPVRPPPASIAANETIDRVTLCDLQKERDIGTGHNRAVAMTASIGWEMHYGFSFIDVGCKGSWGLPTAMMSMSYADGAAVEVFREMWSPDTVQSHEGKRPMCVCIGRVIFEDGYSEFQLIRVERTWWETP